MVADGGDTPGSRSPRNARPRDRGKWFAEDVFSQTALSSAAYPHPPFSFAGREQRRVRGSGKGHVIDASTRGFCARSFERGEGLQVEPWVERLADFSCHGYVTRAGTVLAGETREQQCDAMGRYIRRIDRQLAGHAGRRRLAWEHTLSHRGRAHARRLLRTIRHRRLSLQNAERLGRPS